MNKKIVIAIIVVIVAILVIVGGVILALTMNKPKITPEEIWNKYISNINEGKYEDMYNMITEESKGKVSQEDFIKRNQNIYEGIDMANMKVEIKNVEEEENKVTRISYNISMETSAGNIDFSNSVRLDQDKEKGYLIKWSSSLIFPQLNSTDKVRIKTIEPERGEILDKNGKILAGEGKVSSIGIVPGKLGENKDEGIQKIAELLGTTPETINKSLSASWVKEDSFVPIKKVSTDANELKQQLLQIPGIKINTATSRIYPLGEAAAHLTGYVQNITAEELEANKGKGYNANSTIGRAGLEKEYEERLKGKSGLEI